MRLSLRWVGRFNLGDEVWYEGEKWILYQGVDDPFWKLLRDEASGRKFERIHMDHFVKVRTPKNYWRSFRSGYRFYMLNWYRIWVEQGVQDWMRECKIWAGGKPE